MTVAMSASSPHLAIRGVRVRISWAWLGIAAIVCLITLESLAPEGASTNTLILWYAAAILILFLAGASLVLHDIAHVVVARRTDANVTSVDPQLLGALDEAALRAEQPASEARVAAAGPAASLTLALLLALTAWALRAASVEVVARGAAVLALVNVAIGLLNLLPGYPLDGGRMLRAFLWFLSDSRVVATRIAAFYGQVIFTASFVGGFVLVALGNPYAVWGTWLLLAVWSASRAGREGVARVAWSEAGRDFTVSDIGLASSIRIDANRSIDSALDDLLDVAPDGLLLVEEDGQVIGVIDTALLRRIPRTQWARRPLRDATRSVDNLPRVPADVTVDQLFTTFDRSGSEIVLVEARGSVVSAIVRRTAVRKLHERLSTQRRPTHIRH